VTPAVTAQTRANIARFCELHRIEQELLFSDEPLHNTDRSRVAAFDRNGLLLRHIGEHRDQWTIDGGQNHNKHGWRVQASYRSKTRPSLQVCVVPARGGEYDYMLLIDIDASNPFTDPIGHTGEVLHNKLLRKTTDPSIIASMLSRAIEKAT
jgi:hypothetical protein